MKSQLFKWIAAGVLAVGILSAQTSPEWKGDLTGTWQGPYTPDLTRNTTAKLTPWGEQQFAKFDGRMNPCLPVGVTRLANAPDPVQIVQTPQRIVILYESWHMFRSIPTDGKNHAISSDPSWLGTSVAKWDGDTLVVDVTHMNAQTKLDTVGHPHSEDIHLTERFRRTGPATMSYEVTVDDPKTYTAPWTHSRTFKLMPNVELMEYVCLENEKDIKHLIGIEPPAGGPSSK
jgi:hypothetical protein